VKDHGVKKTKAYALVAEAISGQAVRIGGPQNNQTLTLTGKIQPARSVEHDDAEPEFHFRDDCGNARNDGNEAHFRGGISLRDIYPPAEMGGGGKAAEMRGCK